jgi:hypothetical protein
VILNIYFKSEIWNPKFSLTFLNFVSKELQQIAAK